MFLSRPEPVTITVCDAVHLDPVSKRKTLVGVYAHVVADAFPCVMPTVWLYAAFSRAQGIFTLTVCVRDGDDVLLCAGGRVACGDLGSTYDLTTPVSGLTFARPGVYTIEALADGVAFARRELRVIAKEPAAVPVAVPAPSAS